MGQLDHDHSLWFHTTLSVAFPDEGRKAWFSGWLSGGWIVGETDAPERGNVVWLSDFRRGPLVDKFLDDGKHDVLLLHGHGAEKPVPGEFSRREPNPRFTRTLNELCDQLAVINARRGGQQND